MKLFSCLLLLVLSLVPLCARAQSTSATISGGITDAAGNFIQGAIVEIADDETGILYSARTNNSGMYTVPVLPPGHYHVQVSKQGFKTIIKPDVVLNVQSAVALNFTLPIGSTSQSITVEAGSSLLNTTDASVSTVIDRKFVENIPLNGRSFQDLIAMTPGVVTQSPQAQSSLAFGGDFSVNGQRTESNYYSVDGVSANTGAGNGYGGPQAGLSGSLAASTALGTTQSLLSVDALQEFRVQSSTYSAEFGRSPGGQFALSTRSGSKAFHGSVFDYLRNDFFDANDWFNDHYQKPISALRQNDFGGTAGGPIVIPRIYNGKDRSFFFVSYEGLRLTLPQAATIQYVPDVFMRQQAVASIQPILNTFPIANGIDYGSAANPSLAQFIAPYSSPSRIDSVSTRIDHNFSPRLAIFFRFGDTPSTTASRTLAAVTETTINTSTYTLGVTSHFSPVLDNEFHLGYARADSSAVGSLDAFGGATPINLAEATGVGGYRSPQEAIILSFAGGYSNLTLANGSNKDRQWNLVDNVSLSLGHHQLKIGADYRRIKSPRSTPTPVVEGIFSNPQSVLTNQVSTLILVKYLSSTPIFNEFAAFIQDEWHISPKLNLSTGLRWEVDPPPSEAQGNLPYTLLGSLSDPASLTLAPKGTPLWKTTWYNFAPRLGVAWTAHATPGWETILRTGGGVFFDTDNQLAINGFSGLGFFAESVSAGSPLPVTSTQLNFTPSTVPPYTSSSIYAFPDHLQLPYTLEWNASLQQALGIEQAVTITYVGSNGRRLIQTQESSLHSLNPNLGTVFYVPAGITSNYQALQLQYQRSVKRGLQTITSYTWSHSSDFGSTAAALPTQRADSDFDIRNNFTAGLSWDLPHFSSRKIPEILFNHWSVDGRVMARGGFPVTLNGNLLTDAGTGSYYYGGLNLVPNTPLYLRGSQYPGGRAINKAAFTPPPGSSVGNAPRNLVRGFGEFQTNMAVRREFTFGDKARLQFRAETFNTLNHPNFGYVDPIYTDTTFGQATKMLNASLGTVASQYQQGGPRSMQFALKLLF
jgi:hypothetical protein